MQEPAHIRPLTSLRFFAAAWVVLYAYWPLLAADAAPALAAKGYLGVELFFVLSGFILCHVYLGSVQSGRFVFAAFLWNRLARVYPLHLATLGAMIVMGLAAGAMGHVVGASVLDWRALPANLLLVQAWGFAPTAAFNHASWSVSAEAFAYLAFPLFALAAARMRTHPWIFAAAALAFIALSYPIFERLAGFPITEATIRFGWLRIIPPFLLGCAMHGLWRSGALASAWAAPGACFFGAAAALIVQLHAPDSLAVMAFGGLILCLAALPPWAVRIAGQRVLVYLGEISYAIYMVCIPWQVLFVNAVRKACHLQNEQLPWPLWIIFVTAVVPLAAAAYSLIEQPARRALKLWGKRLDQRAAHIVTG